jgi:hypothetical protein
MQSAEKRDFGNEFTFKAARLHGIQQPSQWNHHGKRGTDIASKKTPR